MGSKARAREDVRPVKTLLPHKQQAPTMSSPLKSRASQKFRANHPYQHQMFADLVKSAKLTKSKFLFQREEEEMNSEVSNMMMNQQVVKVRPGDLTQRRRSGKVKSVSWRKSLCDVCPPTKSSTQEISQQVNTNLFTSSPVERSMTGLQQLHVGSSVALSGSSIALSSSSVALSSSSVALSGSSVFSLPESDQQTCQPNCQYLGTSHYSLYPGLLSLESSPEISSSESLPHESTPSSPESSSPESSSPSRSKSLSKSEGCLKFTFFTTCDSSLERQW